MNIAPLDIASGFQCELRALLRKYNAKIEAANTTTAQRGGIPTLLVVFRSPVDSRDGAWSFLADIGTTFSGDGEGVV